MKIAPALLLALCNPLMACGEDPDPPQPPQPPRFLSGPAIVKNPNPVVPLAAIISFTTDVKVSVRFQVTRKQQSRTIDFRQQGQTFKLPLLGLQPDSAFAIKVTITDALGASVTAPQVLSFTTPPLPANFPPLEVKISKPSEMEPGVILISPNGAYATKAQPYLLALNAAGEVVWFRSRPSSSATFTRRLKNGNLAYLALGNSAIEMDMLANVVRQWHAANHGQTGPAGSIPVKIDAIHHDLYEMPSGNLLLMSKELRTFQDYPTSQKDPNAPKQTSGVVGDVIAEVRPDGAVVNTWSMLDLLDPYRIGYNSLNNNTNVAYTKITKTAKDWSHANTVIYREEDDTILVSLRHQDAIIKFSRKTGKLIWILGPHDNWKSTHKPYLLQPQGGMQWQYHQHGLMFTPQGTLLTFDNGKYRAVPFDAVMDPLKSYSRVMEFSIDESKMQIREAWKYGGPGDEQFFSPAVCDVLWMPKTGNVLVVDGNRWTRPELPPADKQNHLWSRLVEVTHTTPAKKVFEVIFDDKSDVTSAINWRIHHGEKLPNIYPASMVR